MPDSSAEPGAVPEPGDAILRAGLAPSQPGPFFRRRVLEDRRISVERAASEMDIDTDTLENFVWQKRDLDWWLAAKIAKFTDTSVGFWLNMQAAANRAR